MTPGGAMTAEERQQIREQAVEIIGYLTDTRDGPRNIDGLAFSLSHKIPRLLAEVERLEKERDARVDRAESSLAGLADCINQELRENGPVGVNEVADYLGDMRPYVRRLVDVMNLKAEAQVARLRDRDELWCRALGCLSIADAARVLAVFNKIRPDAAPSSPGRPRRCWD